MSATEAPQGRHTVPPVALYAPKKIYDTDASEPCDRPNLKIQRR